MKKKAEMLKKYENRGAALDMGQNFFGQ